MGDREGGREGERWRRKREEGRERDRVGTEREIDRGQKERK